MPEGRQRFSTGNGPPGSTPGGPTPDAWHDAEKSDVSLNMVNYLQEKQMNAPVGTTFIENAVTQSARISIFESHRLNCRRGMHERPDIKENFTKAGPACLQTKTIKCGILGMDAEGQ